MPQVNHVTATSTATDISTGLGYGSYVAQVLDRDGDVLPRNVVGVLYGSAASEPSTDNDYFHCRTGDYFTFTVSAATGPVWVKTARVDGSAIGIALART